MTVMIADADSGPRSPNLHPKFSLKQTVGALDSKTLCDYIASQTGLSKSKIKDALNKGAAWLKKKGGHRRRVRRASTALNPGDSLEFYYDARLLERHPPQGRCLHDYQRFSVWYKPSGLLSQGTLYGDHCALLRQAEIFFRFRRPVYLVHRLDREASGLLLIAHRQDAAAVLSRLFRDHRVLKSYRIEVLGDLSQVAPSDTIALPLDGQNAVTEFEVSHYDPRAQTSTVAVTLKTGRRHQIRRHFEMIGFPVMGDPRYGRGNKDPAGMRLVATALAFRCPFRHKELAFTLAFDANALLDSRAPGE
ncbi:MAG: RluA family pseudouridine synthase [Desulfobacterales bacterium]|nr:MAG: RluA family pseudouridine synthase [Desulfobacterales bacterium]